MCATNILAEVLQSIGNDIPLLHNDKDFKPN
jgi:hypothetical protein